MNKLIPAIAVFALLGGCGGTTTTANDSVIVGNDTTVIPADELNLTADPALPGQQFADTVAASDAYEIAAGKLAAEKATVPALKQFGTMMVTAHTESSAKLKAAAASVTPAIVPDATLTAEQAANLETLKDATGADFDAAYKSQQQIAHRKALAAVQAYAAGGDVPAIKAWAGEVQPVIEQHRAMIDGM